jgi:hypothetical protein
MPVVIMARHPARLSDCLGIARTSDALGPLVLLAADADIATGPLEHVADQRAEKRLYFSKSGLVSGDADASKIPSFGLSTAESARHSTRPYSIVWAAPLSSSTVR